jgi:hypothetical protein
MNALAWPMVQDNQNGAFSGDIWFKSCLFITKLRHIMRASRPANLLNNKQLAKNLTLLLPCSTAC